MWNTQNQLLNLKEIAYHVTTHDRLAIKNLKHTNTLSVRRGW